MIKNIILTSAVDDKNYKGIISVENTSNKTLINLKTYNLPNTNNKRVLGIIIDGDLYKVEIKNDENFVIEKSLDLTNKISVVVLEIENNQTKILIWGSNETSRVWKNSVLLNLESDNTEQTPKIKENNTFGNDNIADNFITNLAKEVINDDYESDEYIEKLVDGNFLKSEILENDIVSPINDTFENEDKNVFEENKHNKSEFLLSVEQQINELLNTYEEEKALEEIIPSSKFVKVDVENNGNFYIFGVIYEYNEIKYIVYGLPGEYNVKPEDEYSKFYQWLPLNNENPEGYGYYLMYQEAMTGEQVQMIID